MSVDDFVAKLVEEVENKGTVNRVSMENNQNNPMEMAGGDKNGQSGVVYGKIGKGQSAAGDHPTGSGMPQDGRPGKTSFFQKKQILRN